MSQTGDIDTMARHWDHAGLSRRSMTRWRRRVYPSAFRAHLSIALGVRHTADYGAVGVSSTVANRMVRRAAAFVSAVQEGAGHGPKH